VNFVDVSIEYPVLLTPRMDVTTDTEYVPSATPLSGGIVVDAGFFRFNGCTLGVMGAVRGWGASWDTEPALAARVWDGAADFSVRWSPEETHVVTGWWDIGTGIRVGVLTADWWDDVATLGVGAHSGMGIVAGKGKVRATASLRLDLSIRFDSWTGTLATGSGTTSWWYYPGSARLSALVGVDIR
jgi:hypothetical protein